MPIWRIPNRLSVRQPQHAPAAAHYNEAAFRVPPDATRRTFGRARLLLLILLMASACDGAPPPPPKHLLLITVDTLRSDHVGAYGDELGLTPEIDRLAGESVLFTSAYAGSAFTLPSIAAILTGLYPEELGIWNNESGVPDSAETLASILRSRGWRTGAVVSNFVLRSSTGLDRSFDLFDDTFTNREATRKWPERIAPRTTDAALLALDDCTLGDAPCFLWVHYQDPHGPYTPPKKLRAKYIEAERARTDGSRRLPVGTNPLGLGGIPDYQFFEDQNEVAFYRAGYDAEIRLMDREVGRLLEGVKGRGLMDETAVVFAADHGESLGEGDYWFAHGAYLTDALVHVPLMIRVPGRSGDRRDDLVSLIDVVPTLLPLMLGGSPAAEPTALRGRNLLAEGASAESSTPYMATLGSSSIQRFGLVKGELKLVASYRDDKWSTELFERGSDGIDLSKTAAGEARKLRRELVEVRNSLEVPEARVRPKISPQERANLEALGYVERPEAIEAVPPPTP